MSPDVCYIGVLHTMNKKKLVNRIAHHTQDQQTEQFFPIHRIFKHAAAQDQHGEGCDEEAQAIENYRIEMLQCDFDDGNISAPEDHHAKKN